MSTLANADSYLVRVNGTLTRTAGTGLLANDSSTLTGPLRIVSNTNPGNGILTLSADGAFTYKPTALFDGSDAFTYTVADASGATATAVARVNVLSSPPIGALDVYETFGASSLTFSGSQGVLGNDASLIGAPLRVVSYSQPVVYGGGGGTPDTISITADGAITITRASNDPAFSTFTYVVSDGFEETSVRSSIGFGLANGGATPDTYVLRPGQMIRVGANDANGIIYNDPSHTAGITDVTIISFDRVSGRDGAFTYSSDGAFTYQAPTLAATETYRYVAVLKPVTTYMGAEVTFYTTNAIPSVTPDAYVTVSNVPLTRDAGGGLLANDFDADVADVVRVSAFTQPAHGAVTVGADGAFSYTPARDYVGPDSFTYTVTDGVTAPAALRPVTVSLDVGATATTPGGAGDADLRLTGTAPSAATSTLPGFNLRLTNSGPGPATNIVVRLTPQGGTLNPNFGPPSTGVYSPAAETWTIPFLDVGTAATLSASLRVTDAATAGIVGEIVQADQPDPDSRPGDGAPLDDDIVYLINAKPAVIPGAVADLSLAGVYGKGAGLGYIDFTVTNPGPSGASGVKVQVAPGAGAVIPFTNLDQGAYDASSGTWSVGTLPRGESAILRAFLNAGAQSATAQVLAQDQRDPDSTPGNGAAGEDDIVVIVDGVVVTPTPPANTNTPPVIAGAVAGQPDAAGAPIRPFATLTVTDPDVGQTETVTVRFAGANGVLSGVGLTGSDGVYTVTGSAAQVQAALQAASFTPAAGRAATTAFTITVTDGIATASDSTTSVIAVAASGNTPPAISGAVAGQPDTAGTPIRPFAALTVSDPDAGQTESVTISFPGANGVLAGGGFAGSNGSYTVSGSLAEVQAALRAVSFTPTAGVSATTAFSVSVSDGIATANDTTTTVVAKASDAGGGAGGGAVGGTGGGGTLMASTSQMLKLDVQATNLSRASAAQLADPTSPLYAQAQAELAIAAALDAGRIGAADAQSQLFQLVDGTTSAANLAYAFFTGRMPTAAGLNFLVNSPANPTDLNDAYFTRFSTDNRYINLAVSLSTGEGAGAARFAADYGGLSLPAAATKAYEAVFGFAPIDGKIAAILSAPVSDGRGGTETRAQYFADLAGGDVTGQKAAVAGWLLSESVKAGFGAYQQANLHFLDALAHGQAVFGVDLLAVYGQLPPLVGVAVPDPTLVG